MTNYFPDCSFYNINRALSQNGYTIHLHRMVLKLPQVADLAPNKRGHNSVVSCTATPYVAKMCQVSFYMHKHEVELHFKNW